MKQLTKQELKEIQGGSASAIGIGALIVGVAIFLIGVFDGYTRPLKCNS